ncbi:hypothetical protein D3C80_649760 [compost metagenome]
MPVKPHDGAAHRRKLAAFVARCVVVDEILDQVQLFRQFHDKRDQCSLEFRHQRLEHVDRPFEACRILFHLRLEPVDGAQRLQPCGDDDAVGDEKMQPADIARFAVELLLEVDQRAVDQLLVENDRRMGITRGESRKHRRRHTRQAFQKGRYPAVGKVQMQPEKTVLDIQLSRRRLER